jgi:abequosyltransferase
MADVRFSVCIPAYNRPEVLGMLLDSILTQDYSRYEILIGEDNSPRRNEIRGIVTTYQRKYPNTIIYFENDQNLGFDAHIRRLVQRSRGEYCFFMGNDDLMCPNALSIVSAALDRYRDIGVVMRSYASFDKDPARVNQIFRYFEKEKLFSPGAQTVVTFFRRSVVIPGVVIHRRAALKYSTDRFDGTLLYQIYLVANILVDMNGLFLPDIIVLYRNGGIPEFGNSPKELGKFVPKVRTPASSLQFMRGMLEIGRYTEDSRKLPVYKSILRDLGNYSYPILSVQSKQPFGVFLRYSFDLAKLGFWKNHMFYVYFLLLAVFGSRRVDAMIRRIKNMIGHTPVFGTINRD